MTHLRIALPLLPDQEMDGWVEDILENTHYRDIKALHQKLGEAI
jgi:fumarate hydratase class II